MHNKTLQSIICSTLAPICAISLYHSLIFLSQHTSSNQLFPLHTTPTIDSSTRSAASITYNPSITVLPYPIPHDSDSSTKISEHDGIITYSTDGNSDSNSSYEEPHIEFLPNLILNEENDTSYVAH